MKPGLHMQVWPVLGAAISTHVPWPLQSCTEGVWQPLMSTHACALDAAESPLPQAAHAESSLVADQPAVRRLEWQLSAVWALASHCPVLALSEYVEPPHGSQASPSRVTPCPLGHLCGAHLTPAFETTLLNSKDAHRVQSSPPFPAIHWPQSVPVKPAAHLQLKPSTPSTHVPPALAWQAAPSPEAHSSMLVSH